jgi:ribosomal protein S7
MNYFTNYYTLFKLVNFIIKNGKKDFALNLILNVIKRLKFYFKENNLSFSDNLNIALSNIKPILYFTKIKKARKVFYLPQLINSEREINISLN